jgi:hypothetical protein
LEGKAGILAITLNPVITFFRVLLSTLFTKFPTYSQVASCVKGKKLKTLGRLMAAERLIIQLVRGTGLAFFLPPP